MKDLPKKKDTLLGKTLAELDAIAMLNGWPRYTALQIAEWLYKHSAGAIDQMTNISKSIRQELAGNYVIGHSEPINEDKSSDGTVKYLFATRDGGYVETVYIPEGKRHTLCVSSQVGCRMGCAFCMTARQGLHGQLSAGEILNQIRSIPGSDRLTNIVYMGMGEPLDNLDAVMDSLEILSADYGLGMSPRRITISTIGILPAIQTFLEKSRCHLAISLHSPFTEERKRLVPMEKAHPLSEIMETIRHFPQDKQRRISFEYIVFKDLNHSQKHVNALARLLQGIRCRVNLIRFHPIPDSPLKAPDEEDLRLFGEAIEKKGLITTIRKSRGLDIQAACGLLATQAAKQSAK